MIQLPPGMTVEEYFASPQGQAGAQAQQQFQRSLQPSYGPTTRAGRAQPRNDPYASSTKPKGVNDIAKEIEAALVEMAPELDPGERSLMAADLAREYSRERQSAARDMARGPRRQSPDQGREWKWDGNQYEYTDTPEYKAKQESMLASRMSASEQQARRIQRVRAQQDRNNAAMAQGAAGGQPGYPASVGQAGGRKLGKFSNTLGPSGVVGMQVVDWHNPATGESFQAPHAGYKPDEPGWRQGEKPSPGAAQAIPPQSSGTAYGQPSQQDMYWQLVAQGTDPAQASSMAAKAFRYAPK